MSPLGRCFTLSPLALALVVLAASGMSHAAATTPGNNTVQLTIDVVLVDGNMAVKPVPLHTFLLISSSGDTTVSRTSLEGHIEVKLPSGDYLLKNSRPVQFQEQLYIWELPLSLTANARRQVHLTNDNATINRATMDKPPVTHADRTDPAAELFNRLGPAVFRVQSGLAHGTGFLADTLGGVIITNAHVVESGDQARVTVLLRPDFRVAARVLARDSDADIAVLQIHPTHLTDLPRLSLHNPATESPVIAGERLVAMGYPLSQQLTITTGIASSVRAGAVISDVNINPGNSGGPLLNVDGHVVAVNTFGEGGASGPGVSGSVLVSRAAPALAQALSELESGAPPGPDALPTCAEEGFAMASLKAVADTTDPDEYDDFFDLSVAGFSISVSTPVSNFIRVKTYENAIAKDRKKREAKANLPEAERYSEVREYRDWLEYAGPLNNPLIAIAVKPEVGETGGSLFTRMMLGPGLQAQFKFKGDVRDMQLVRNGELIESVKGGHAPMKMLIEDRWVSLKDVADMGYFLFDPEAFRPDSAGMPPQIIVLISDLKNPKKLKCRELPSGVIARAWNDFALFYEERRPSAGFIPANPKLAKGREAAWSTGMFKKECDWSSLR